MIRFLFLFCSQTGGLINGIGVNEAQQLTLLKASSARRLNSQQLQAYFSENSEFQMNLSEKLSSILIIPCESLSATSVIRVFRIQIMKNLKENEHLNSKQMQIK